MRFAIEEVETSRLPADGRTYPGPEELAAMGSRWAQEGRTAVLSVPSAIIPAERNFLLNPAHSTYRAIRIGRPEPFVFAQRMWKKRS